MTEFCKGDRVRLPADEAVVDAATCKHCGEPIEGRIHPGTNLMRCLPTSDRPYGYNAEPEGTDCVYPCLGAGWQSAFEATPSPQPEPHGIGLDGRCDECDPQPEPTGLVERVVEQIVYNGHPSTIEERAAAGALAVADWLEDNHHQRAAVNIIRREVEGADRA